MPEEVQQIATHMGMPSLPPVPPATGFPSLPPLPPPLPPSNPANLEPATQNPDEQPRRRRRRTGAVDIEQEPGTTTAQEGERRPQTMPPPNPISEGNAKPKFWVSTGATINIGSYESMKLDIGVSGIDYDASTEEIERIMASADVGIHETIESLMSKIIDRAREIKIARGLPVGEE